MTDRQLSNQIRKYHAELHRRALAVTADQPRDYLSTVLKQNSFQNTLVRGMDPKRLSQSDVSSLLLILGIPESAQVDVARFCRREALESCIS